MFLSIASIAKNYRAIIIVINIFFANSSIAGNINLETEFVLNGKFQNGTANWLLDANPIPQKQGCFSGLKIPAGSNLVQKIEAHKLKPGASYTLKVTGSSSTGTAAVIFRIPEWNQSYRTFNTLIDGTATSLSEVSFIAPNFLEMAEIRIKTTGSSPLTIKNISLKERAPIVNTQLVISAKDSYVPKGYKLVFNDEFNGSDLDRSKWFTRYIYENETLDHFKQEQQRYRDNKNHVVSSGQLNLVARPTSNGLYESGMIRSAFTIRYGYFEARVKMPKAKGVFPAFWLLSDVGSDGKHSWPPEIDIFEYVNNGVEDTPNMIHSGVVPHANQSPAFLFTDSTFNKQWSFWKAPYNFDQDWHTIAAEWTENSVKTFIDGREIVEREYPWKYSDGRLASPAYIMLNLAIGGDWAGRNGIDVQSFPASLEIDWVRAYQKAETN